MGVIHSLKCRVGAWLDRQGIVVYRVEPGGEAIRPQSTYSPWCRDDEFNSMIGRIAGHTLCDKLRLWELWTLTAESSKLEEGALIEVGSWRGGSGAIIAEQARRSGIKDPVFICDTFTGVVKASDVDGDYHGGEHSDTSRAIAEKLLLTDLQLQNVRILEGIFPEQTGRQTGACKFRFCHIDVDTYQSAKDITDWIWPRMALGGIIVHDDYGFKYAPGITKHVEEQRHCADRLIIHNLNGHGIVIKVC